MLYGDAKENPQAGAPCKPIIKAPYSCGLYRSSEEAFVMNVERRVQPVNGLILKHLEKNEFIQ